MTIAASKLQEGPLGAPREWCVMHTPWHSWKAGELAEGCRLCVEGKKLVLFMTGLCGQRCGYCPVSELKFGQDVVYANEWKLEDLAHPKELLEEARLTRAKGAGITGGDPLIALDRTCSYIRLLKRTFGKSFHIHLYTPLLLVDEKRLARLYRAGLDEIRFHPNLDDTRLWERLKLARAYDWSVGIEIPVVPCYGSKIRALIDFIIEDPKGHLVDFINLNELELSDTKVAHYALGGKFKPKDKRSYGVRGSLALAKRIAAYAAKKGLPAHVCSARLKDGVQMRQRLLRRAEGVALGIDTKTPAGTLIRGAAYLPVTRPGVGYRRKLAQQRADDHVRAHLILQLDHVRGLLLEQTGLAPDTILVDEKKLRLILSVKDVKRYAPALRALHLVPAIVEEYPTQDGLEAEIEFL